MSRRDGQQLIAKLRGAGFEVEENGAGHYTLLRDGETVRARDGLPIRLAMTPSDRRYLANMVALLKREGVIDLTVRAERERKRTEMNELADLNRAFRKRVKALADAFPEANLGKMVDAYGADPTAPGPSPYASFDSLRVSLLNQMAGSNVSVDHLAALERVVSALESGAWAGQARPLKAGSGRPMNEERSAKVRERLIEAFEWLGVSPDNDWLEGRRLVLGEGTVPVALSPLKRFLGGGGLSTTSLDALDAWISAGASRLQSEAEAETETAPVLRPEPCGIRVEEGEPLPVAPAFGMLAFSEADLRNLLEAHRLMVLGEQFNGGRGEAAATLAVFFAQAIQGGLR